MGKVWRVLVAGDLRVLTVGLVFSRCSELFFEFVLPRGPVTAVTVFMHVPSFDGGAFSVSNYEEKVAL